jgi:hypothetical protein
MERGEIGVPTRRRQRRHDPTANVAGKGNRRTAAVEQDASSPPFGVLDVAVLPGEAVQKNGTTWVRPSDRKARAASLPALLRCSMRAQ